MCQTQVKPFESGPVVCIRSYWFVLVSMCIDGYVLTVCKFSIGMYRSEVVCIGQYHSVFLHTSTRQWRPAAPSDSRVPAPAAARGPPPFRREETEAFVSHVRSRQSEASCDRMLEWCSSREYRSQNILHGGAGLQRLQHWRSL